MSYSEHYNRLINFISFTDSEHRLHDHFEKDDPKWHRDKLDDLVIRPNKNDWISSYFNRYPSSLIEQYRAIIALLDNRNYKQRLVAFDYIKTINSIYCNHEMGLNISRLRLALVRVIMSDRYTKRYQMECIRDFSNISFGQDRIIRRCLKKMRLIELPKGDSQLSDLNMAFDHHVEVDLYHYSNNISKLLLDAYIKGIGSITLVIDSLSDRDSCIEALDAGASLGINVSLALKFSVREDGKESQYLAVLPLFLSSNDFIQFYNRYSLNLQDFSAKIINNQKKKSEILTQNIERFNRTYLHPINKEFEATDECYQLAALNLSQIQEVAGDINPDQIDLGALLYYPYRDLLLNRIFYLKAMLTLAQWQYSQHIISNWNFTNMERNYKQNCYEYENLDRDQLQNKYFSGALFVESASTIRHLSTVAEPLRQVGAKIRLINPLSIGLEAASAIITKQALLLDEVDIYNLYDSRSRAGDELIGFAEFIDRHNSSVGSDRQVRAICGSSNGAISSISGIGFMSDHYITNKQKKQFSEHLKLPPYISSMISNGYIATSDSSCYYSLSYNDHRGGNKLYYKAERYSLKRTIKYLNPLITNISTAVIAFFITNEAIGSRWAFILFLILTITGVMSNLFRVHGDHSKPWQMSDINFSFQSQTLLFNSILITVLEYIYRLFNNLLLFNSSEKIAIAAMLLIIMLVNALAGSLYHHIQGVVMGSHEKKISGVSLFLWPIAFFTTIVFHALSFPVSVIIKIWYEVILCCNSMIHYSRKCMQHDRHSLIRIVSLLSHESYSEQALAAIDMLYLFAYRRRGYRTIKHYFKAQVERSELADLRLVVDWFSNHHNYTDLCSFIIKNYNREEQFFLVNLVNEQRILLIKTLKGLTN